MNISWLKLDVNILDNNKIKIIRSYPDGNTIILLWIGILCLAMKSQRPGIIEIADGIPYDVEDFAKLFNIEKKTVELGLRLFEKYNMISVFNGGAIEVINFANMQSIEKIQRTRELGKIRTANYRKKLKLPAPDDSCDACVTRHTVTVTLTDKNKIREDKKREELSVHENFPKEKNDEISCQNIIDPLNEKTNKQLQPFPKKGDTKETITKERLSTKFIKPTEEEVKEYCKEKGYSINPERFINYYESIGWFVGKKKMVNWKASVRTWESKNKERIKQELAIEDKQPWER